MAISNANKSPENGSETPLTSTGSESSFSPEDPRPRYYICRDDKTLVPLIAVDELPPIIRLHGVPLSLAAADIEEWDMSRCGDVIDRAKNLYRIEFNTNSSSYQSARTRKPPAAPHAGKQESHVDSTGNDTRAPKPPQADQEPSACESLGAAPASPDSDSKSLEYESLDPPAAAVDYEDTKGQIVRDLGSNKVQHPSKTPNAATPGIYGRKKYCTYWIRTGNCDYIQEGCKFLHVIPDAETRLRIGIRDMPRWAREEIPAPEDQYHPKRQTGTGQDWRRQAPPVSRDPPLGRVTELPEASGSRARAALPDAAPPSYAGQANVQNGNSDPRFMHFTTQQLPNEFKHANQHDQTRLNTAKPTQTSSSASAAAESFQRQMQSYRSVSPSPTSTPRRSSPTLQPPIARPTTNAYTAPDKLPGVGRAANVAQNPFGRGYTRNYPNSAFAKAPGIDSSGSSLFRNSQQPRTPMDARFANMALGSPFNTGTADGSGYRAPDLMSGSVNPLSSRPFGSLYPETLQAANQGANQNGQFNGNVSPSFFTQPTVTHKRRFVTPGESKFVVTSAAEDNNGAMTATTAAGQPPRTNSDGPRSRSGQRRARSGDRRSHSGQHRRSYAKAQNGDLVDTSP